MVSARVDSSGSRLRVANTHRRRTPVLRPTIAALAVAALPVAGVTSSASAAEFRSPDKRIYCYFSTTEPAAGCMTGRGSKFRLVWAIPTGETDWDFAWSPKWYSQTKTPARGRVLRVGQSVRYISSGPSRVYMGITCKAVAPRQVTCWETGEGLWPDGQAAGQPVSGFTMFSRCGRPASSYDPPTLLRVTPCSEAPGIDPPRF